MNVPAPSTIAERNRERILDAATALFAERGYFGAQVPEIAARAGVGVGTIYRRFPDKQALVNAVYARCKTAFMDALLEAFPFDAAPRAQFDVFWLRMAAFARAEPEAFKFLELHHHGPYLSEESRALELRALAPVVQFVAAASAAGVLEDAPVELLISLCWGAFVGMFKAAELGHLRLTDDVIRQGGACCWDALRRIAETHDDEETS